MPDETIIPYTFKGQDLTGKTFKHITVLGFVKRIVYGTNYKFYYKCRCVCGKEWLVESFGLKSGGTTSCGCVGFANRVKSRIKHGGAIKENGKVPRMYEIWKGMIKRCTNPNSNTYHNYGGRGIQVLWKNFEQFRNDMLPTYQPHLTIERIDVNGNYCKENCRWATWAEQAMNTRLNTILTFNGKSQCLRMWEKDTGIKFRVLQDRNSRGWSPERILTQSVRGRKTIQTNGM